ncbi:sacsin-like [Acropora muricata]|uniref:sacsin-like n=1 Tax=Acropora muricata TaxID=159855 RepID=UPI0034E51046
MAEKGGRSFGLIQPTLIQQLKKILDEYPDDGQILKELIQNAEDAGATQVKFLHDRHSHGISNLYDDDLAEFQGPALYAYNNERFNSQDWRGIQLLSDSIKIEDPMKVGRFGLGFKSVFHITDLPSLLSDCQIGFIDPHGVHFSEKRCQRTGKLWNLQEDLEAMGKVSGQFSPYKGIFDCTDEVFSRGFYDGTLFRFPLRKTPSELSETVYSADKVETLFKSFKADAHLVLLFLQCLEKIELYVRDELERIPRKVFEVKISEETLQTVRAKRKEFRQKLVPGKVMPSSVAVTYPITIETVDFDFPGLGTAMQHSFLVTSYLCGGQISSTFRNLISDKVLSYLPSVGIAMPLPTGPKLQSPDVQGHVFCSLPLPVQKTSLTGLPVHVNGFFALSQNRRYIKSPNAEQTGGRLTDKSLLWNKCLLEEAVPRAYATMILEAISENSAGFVNETTIYKAWPDVKQITQNWDRVTKPLLQILLKKEIVFTPAGGGNWLTVKEALFDLLPESETKNLLQRVILAANFPVVSVPSHVTEAISGYLSFTEITAPLTREVLKRAPTCYKKLERSEKILLLQFCLTDCNFDALHDLELLPLSSGTFTTFSNQADVIYISSPEHPKELLPGLSHRFLDEGVNGDIFKKLKAAARQECTQLRILCKDDVPDLLHQALPSPWSQGEVVLWYPHGKNQNHPPETWIPLVWRYLRENFHTAKDLHRFSNLPLIPVNPTQTPVTLTRLCYPSRVIVKCLFDDVIGDPLTNLLKKLDLIVLTDCPTFVTHHPSVIGNFVHPPSVAGVLKALEVSSSKMARGMFPRIVRKGFSTDEKHVLRSFLANIRQGDLKKKETIVLQSLPIFETLSKKFVSKNDGLCAAPLRPLPIPALQDLIDISQEDSRYLATLLQVRILKPTELLCEMIFPDIHKGKFSGEQIDRLMPYVFKQFDDVISSDATFKRKMKELPFVPTQKQRVTPPNVFDPRKEILRKIFANEDVFPAGTVYNHPATLIMLEKLGMKKEDDITTKELLESARLVTSSLQLSSKNQKQFHSTPQLSTAKQKSKAILQYLNNNPRKLVETINNRQLGSLLRDICWVSRLQERTPQFPPTLPWWNAVQAGKERFFFKPTELKSYHYASLIGTVSPVVDSDPSSKVSSYFGWSERPDVTTVMAHLRNVLTFYSKEEKPFYIFAVDEIYSFLAGERDDTVKQAFKGAEISEWVWNGDGFSSPDHMLSCKPSIDLTPYIRPLPSEMKNHFRLFFSFGMKNESDPSVLLQVLSMMKEKYDTATFKQGPLEVKHDLQLSVDILNEVASASLSQELKTKVLLPTHVKGNTYVRLEPAEHCMYCEVDEWLEREESHNMEYFYVHPNIPNNTARLLGVPSQTHRMLNPVFLGEEFGQEERLTTRLNRLLEDYTDGLAVLKELIQNADDAGATEVKFFYDQRTNDDALTCLIDENMRSCQGPALWVYNDAIFKDEDFINITRLNEATKVHDTEKIGRFGLGFNAVYNLTDVPMFVSRNYFVIFDPHTTYLGNVIANTRKPGIKIDLNKDVKRLHSFKNQFKPFNGVFGCDLHLEKEHNSFDGTLFRFPLRTREQAARSEIKKLFYSDQEMRQLLQMFLDRAMSLLLFTQNVFHLEVYRTSESFVARLPPELMFQVSKSMLQGGIMRELTVPVILPATAVKLDAENQTLLRQCNFLQASSMAAKKARSHAVEPSEFPESSIAIEVHCSVTESGLKFFKRHQCFHEECETWLIVSSMGNGQALQFSKNDPSLLPSASVAVQWKRNESGNFIPVPIVKDVEGSYHNGTIFCYLPLPIHSGLSIHINGPFAVTSNRRHLQKKLEDDKTCYGVKWNSVLLQDSVVSAFLKLLEDVKQIIPGDGSYVYHSLWPRACSVCEDCWSFLASFYEQITSRGHHLFSDGLRWGDISQVVFLDPSLRMNPEIGSVSFSVLQQLTDVNYVVIDLPPEVFQSILDCDLGHKIKGKTFNETRFFRDLLFPNISKISADVRDALVLFALNRNSKDFNELIKNYACIPVSPKGNELKSPRQLVNPYKEASRLFCRDDGMFPFGNESTFLNPQVLTKLEILGMKSSDLPWQDIVERAESVQRLNTSNSKAAVKRAKELLDFLEKKLKRKGEAPPHHLLTRLLQVQFLPVLQKPEYFPLPWKGEEFRRGRGLLVAPENVYLKEKMYLVCCTEPLVSVDVPKRVRNLLRLNDKDVTAGQVLKQLEWAVSAKLDALDRNGFEQVARICTEAYLYLQDNMDSLVNAAKQFLLKRKFILMEKDKLFAPAARVAFEITTDCSPYLFKLPKDFCDRFPNLMIYSGVKKQFDEADYVSSLVAVKQQFDQKQLDETTLQVAVNMGNQLANLLYRDCVDACEVRNKLGCVYLPDSKKVMRDVAELCFKECPWMPDDPDEVFVHEKIPWSTCEQLAVKTRRDEALQQHDIGFPFGQKEKLTNRLKRILTGYQGEKEILKELLQNADDAQATEIYFIKDPRHHPDKRVFKDSWKPLQGPALCVYNNKPFTNADIVGICNLGEGSKGDDPNKTGQYGVGFNAVYQLTDVPSFISKSEEIGDVLCVFDPHCKYIPHSSESRPGRMFKDINMLRQKFPDVFPCYLEEHFPVQNATMFRFPLKSEEMARESQICRTSVTVEKLDEMMEDLKKELFEVLLFVNNVKKISIAAVDDNGQLINDYSVQVVMSEDDARKREEFSCYIKEIGRQVREKRILPINVKVKRRTYTLQLKDNRGMSEQWLIVQQIGLEKPVKQSVSYAFQGDQLGMLPRGGVACLLDSTSQSQREKRAYCFLPLPLRTNLPVHINGHFALDHETRRNLWRGEVGGYQSDWNSALLSDVIASCYLTLLDKVREFIQLPVGQDSKCSSLACSKTMILRRIRSYERLFPSYPINDPFWKTLADAVYQEMNKKKLRLIPLVRSEQGGFRGRSKDLQQTECVELSWFPTTGTGSDQTYFNNLEIKGYFAPLPPRRDEKEEDTKRREESRIKRKAAFEEILLETGFNLVSFSLNVYHSLKEAAVEVYCVSPAVVMDFYKSFSDDDPFCRIGAVPCHVTNTPFKDTEGVVRVLKYCKDDEHFLESLPGLPLLITQDSCLHPFSETQPSCLSRYEDILPRSGSLFVHNRVRLEVFGSVDPRNVSVFCPLDVKTFASQLHLTLPPSYHSEDHYVKWYPESKSGSLPSIRWIHRVWDFLQDFARTATKDKDVTEETMATFIRDLFSPLSKWSLLPSTETSSLCTRQPGVTHFLVPLKKAEAVLDFKDCGTSNQKLVDALRKLGLPELNTAALTTQSIGSVLYSNRDSYEMARNLVATVRSPHSLLFALDQKLKWDTSSLDNKLKLTDAIVVLDYFSRNIGSLTDADREILRMLPFYPSANDVLQNLQGRKVFVIPYEIPATEICVVESILGCLLLRSRQQLSDLFEFLQLESASHCEVYMNFVLRCFQDLSHDGRLTHLRFIRDYISLSGVNENQQEKIEKTRLFEHLKEVELIPSTDGTLKTVSSYHDPCNDVFVAMLPRDSFPPEAFKSEEWLTFLRKIGLIQDVSHHTFLKFAKQVEREAEAARTDDTNKRSKVLVYHLISRPNVVGEGLLPSVRDVAFVAADPVDERLQTICPPIGGRNKAKIPFIAFSGAVVNDHEKIAWTEAHMLPSWADPRFQRYNLRCPHRQFDQYLNNLLSELKIMTKPSVDLVVSHCQTICYHLGGKESERENLSSENLSTIVEVMRSIYSFLQKNAMADTEAKRKLQKTPCILVEKGTKLIFPRQAILELYEHLEIKPFLYRVPPEFGMFHSLFEFLGCSKGATPIHYAMVLEMLQKNSQGETLHPNEVRTCSRAVEGFVDSLQNSEDVSTLSTLYLPAMPSRYRAQNSELNTIPVSLQESKELLFDDAPTYSNRIQGLDQPFVIDLSLMKVKCKSAEVNYEDVLLKLPNPLQPTMLSLVVKEKLADPENTVTVTTRAVNVLKQQLSSVHFGHGIARIVRDANFRKGDANKGVTEDILEGLRTIKLFAVENLSTTLLHNGVLVPGSERKVPYFKERLEVSESHIWKVYVDAANRTDDKIPLSTLLAKVIVDIYGKHLGQNGFVIPEMLLCPPAMIQSLLDRHDIRKDDSSNAVEMTLYPEPGTLIPIEDHHLLDDAFEEFEPGDYVGFQLHDPGLDLMDGTATYIYAIIVEEVTDEDVGLLTKTYRINIGNDKEPVEVKATKLFKFCRLKAIFDEHSGCHRSKQEVFDEISNILTQAWEPHVSEQERRQIIKRLCLRWHPKKNAGNEEFYKSVYQHLASEVARLGGSYDDFFYSWGERARQHGSQREEYRRNFSRRYGAWESSSCQRSWHDLPPTLCTSNPQPEEAKRWFRQAKADLDAGSEELRFSISSCEWICFKFHQAAEKALKAARYCKDADKTNVHNLVENCYGLEDPELVQSARELESLVGDSTRMRYPDRMSYPRIPNDVYSQGMAERAKEVAEKIVERVKMKLP